MFEMLVGVPPYYANDKSELFYNIEHGILSIPKYISNEGRSLIKSVINNIYIILALIKKST